MADFAVADPEEGLNETGNPNPVTPSTLGQRFMSGAATAASGSFTDLEHWYARQDTDNRYSEPKSDPGAINARYPGLNVKEPLPMSVAANMNEAQQARVKQQNILSRYPTGLGNAALGLGADAVSGLLDPVGDAAFMIPVIGETRYAAWLARAGESAGLVGRAGVTLGVGAARGEAGQAILSAGKVGLSDTGIGDYHLGDAAHDLLYAPVAGGLMHGAFSFHGDILGARFAESPEGVAAAGDAATHDAAVRTGAAQLASGNPFDVRPVFDAAKYRSDLMGSTALEAPALDPEAQARTENAVARAAGTPSQADLRWNADAQAARAVPDGLKVDEGQIAEAKAAVEQMRAAGHLTPEDEDLLSRLERESPPGSTPADKAPAAFVAPGTASDAAPAAEVSAGPTTEDVFAARQHIAGAQAAVSEAQSPTLLQAIRKGGGIALRDGKSNYTPEGTVIRQILDKNNRGIINNKNGMRPDYMREHLAQQGWFADHPGDELDIRHLYDGIDREARGNPVYHPHSETAQALKAHASLMEEMDHAGITGREPIEEQAKMLAADRHARSVEHQAWQEAAERAGLAHNPEDGPEAILADAIERDAVRAEANGTAEDFTKIAEGWIDERIQEIDPAIAAEIRNQELEHEPVTEKEHGATGAADEGGERSQAGGAGTQRPARSGESAAGGGEHAGQLDIPGSEPSARQLAAARESSGAGRITASGEQRPADVGLFAPPKRDEQTLFMQRGGGYAPLEAGKKNVQVRGVRRGADALIDRLQMQVNLDRARMARGKDIAPMDRADVREVEDFVHFIGDKMFDKVGLRVLADHGPMGQFEVATHIVSIYRKAIEAGQLTRTTIHELWHYLDQGLSREDHVAVGKEFQKARYSWLMENPWAEQFIDRFSGDLRNNLVGQEATRWIELHGSEDTPVSIGKTDSGADEVRFPWTEENYRYVNRDEYFAETMADKYLDFQDLQDQKAQSVFAHARAIWERMVSGFKQLFGGDATGRIFEGFRKGKQAAPLGPTGYGETLDSRVNASAPYGSTAFEKTPQQAAREQQMDAAVAAQQKLTAYQDLQKRQALIQAVQNFHDQTVNRPTLRHPIGGITRQLPLAQSIDALTRGISEAVRGARESTASEQLARANDFLGGLQSGLDKIPGGMEAWRSRAMTKDWVRELHELNQKNGKPGVSKSPMALEIARAVKQAQDVARMRLNKSGAWIGDYDGYISRTQHNAIKIDQAGYKAWRAFTLERLDQDRTFGDIDPGTDADTFGSNGSDEQRDREIDRFMKGTWDGLSTGVHMSSQAGVGKGGAFTSGSLGKKLSSERVLHWKDADAWREYQEKFGDPVIERGIMNGLHRAAHDAALMRRWGSNPQYTFDNLLRTIKETYRDDHQAISDFQKAEPRLREEFAYLSGANQMPGFSLAWKLRSGVLAWQDITKLGNVLFAHFSAAATKPFQLAYHGVGAWKAYSSVIRNLVEDSSTEGRQTLENLRANATGQTQDIVSGYEPIDGVPGRVAKLRMAMMRLGGLPWLLARQKSGTEWELANFLGQRLDSEFENLKPQTQRALKIYGIDKPEWDTLRTAPDHDTDGQGLTYLTPKAAQRAPDAAIDALAGSRITPGMGTTDIARIRDETRDRLMMKLAGYYSDSADRSTVTPGIPERAMFSRIGGKFGGPIIGQYKTWAAAAVRQLWGQALYGSSRGEAVKALAGLVATGTAVGYLRMVAKDVASGKNPRMLNGDAGNDGALLLSAMVQGGGLGILGDMILGQFEANAGTGRERALKYIATLAGPLIGDVADAGGVAADYADAGFNAHPGKAFHAANAEALHALTGHLPVVNLFYLRTLFNYLIFDRLYDMASPGYNKRYMARVKKQSGGQTYFAPPTHYLGYESYPAH